MKVSELIEILNGCNPDLPIVLDGYEGGLDELGEVETIQIFKDVNLDVGYYGNHEEASGASIKAEWNTHTAIYLPRK